MSDTHFNTPTRFIEVDGDKFAYRRWGNTATDQPPRFYLQHSRGGMDHWGPLMTDGLAAGREVILFNGRGVASSSGTPRNSTKRNRLTKSSMSETLGTYGNHATPKLVELYRRWAASGIGLMFTGNVMIDRRALGEPGNVVIEDESDLPILQQWARAATDQGAALWLQLNHPGKQSPKGLNLSNLAPSAIPFRDDLPAFFDTPREVTPDEIRDIIQLGW